MKSIKRKVAITAAVMLMVSTQFVSAAGYTYGAKGGDISAIQKKLIAAGYNARLNGEYDANTKWAVRLYQKDNNLPVNGVLDAVTYKKLMGKELDEHVVAGLGRMSDDKIAAEMAAGRKATVQKKTAAATDTTAAKTTKKTKVKNNKSNKNGDAKVQAVDKKNTATIKSKTPTNGILDPIAPDFIFTKTGKVSKSISEIITEAERYRGVPYVFGGATPQGFDCSGYVRYVFAKSGIDLPRSADEQYLVGQKIGKHNLQPGDLVFFQTYEEGVSHSGIYIGDGKFISATSSSGVAIASVNDSYWGERYIGAKRVM